ncbi:MAG TPA: hypothetical protein VKB41_11440 [Steroidobacteraceae bacterium]|jgi:hypothetical protein|nr:hypothetical protein [Steroidobacteraceae bacterium]
MSNFTSSRFRSSVSATAAVAITGLILWSFDAYVGYMERTAPVHTAQLDSHQASDLESRKG